MRFQTKSISEDDSWTKYELYIYPTFEDGVVPLLALEAEDTVVVVGLLGEYVLWPANGMHSKNASISNWHISCPRPKSIIAKYFTSDLRLQSITTVCGWITKIPNLCVHWLWRVILKLTNRLTCHMKVLIALNVLKNRFTDNPFNYYTCVLHDGEKNTWCVVVITENIKQISFIFKYTLNRSWACIILFMRDKS
jgi:hypothetical protein